jgi:hypothetical protein
VPVLIAYSQRIRRPAQIQLALLRRLLPRTPTLWLKALGCLRTRVITLRTLNSKISGSGKGRITGRASTCSSQRILVATSIWHCGLSYRLSIRQSGSPNSDFATSVAVDKSGRDAHY